MQSFLRFMRTVFVSAEFAVLLAGVATACFGIEHVSANLGRLSLTGESIKWLALAPLGLAVLIFRESRAIVLPATQRAELHRWPLYEDLRMCGHVARGYATLFATMGLAMWIGRLDPAIQLVVLATSLIGSALCYYSVYLAEIRVNELLSHRLSPTSTTAKNGQASD